MAFDLCFCTRKSKHLNFPQETAAKPAFDPCYYSSPTVFPDSCLELRASVRVICLCMTFAFSACSHSLLRRELCAVDEMLWQELLFHYVQATTWEHESKVNLALHRYVQCGPEVQAPQVRVLKLAPQKDPFLCHEEEESPAPKNRAAVSSACLKAVSILNHWIWNITCFCLTISENRLCSEAVLTALLVLMMGQWRPPSLVLPWASTLWFPFSRHCLCSFWGCDHD